MNDIYDPLEKLTLLAPHAIDLRPMPSGFQRLTPMDIAAKLSKCSRGASLLGRVKVAGDSSQLHKLVRELRTVVVQSRIPWPSNKKTLLPILSETALFEVIHPKTCKTCGGVGTLPTLPKPEICEDCQGGKYAWTEHARARSCEIHHEEWKRKWSRVYIEIVTIPWRWEGEIRQALKA